MHRELIESAIELAETPTSARPQDTPLEPGSFPLDSEAIYDPQEFQSTTKYVPSGATCSDGHSSLRDSSWPTGNGNEWNFQNVMPVESLWYLCIPSANRFFFFLIGSAAYSAL